VSDHKFRNDFIRDLVEADLSAGRHVNIVTRFPPEPNGYPHIGHAKSICLNFGLALEFGGRCHLRYDDTNPETEEIEYVDAIAEDVRWLGFDWGEHRYHASDYAQQLYDWAVTLVRKGKAYVCELSEEELRATRGTVTEPGTPSPWRERPVEESLDLLERMRRGEFADGTKTLRAKIDMAAANMKMRDPLMYRIRREAEHYRSGRSWAIYPMYDWAHGQSDAIEGITHSLCTLEFENNRELYDWYLDALEIAQPRPRQIEFARLAVSYTVVSKRKLLQLVREGLVDGWDDPRMPTLRGLRRRGVRPEAIRAFCDAIGVTKANSVVDVAILEHAIRDDLNAVAPRRLVVLRPLTVELTNWPAGEVDWLDADSWPHDVAREGSRRVPFSGELAIDRDDFAENPPKGFKRLAPGREVRLRHGYVIRCDEVVHGADGSVAKLRCSVDLASRGGATADGRAVAGTIQWVSVPHARALEVRLYDRLFGVPEPDREDNFLTALNPNSLEVCAALAEPAVEEESEERLQFERIGYFYRDPASTPASPKWNRIVALKDSWAKLAAPVAPPRAERPPVAPRESAPSGNPVAGKATAVAADVAARRDRYQDEFGVAPAEALQLASDPGLGRYFEAGLVAAGDGAVLAKWLVHELGRERVDQGLPFDGAALGALVALVRGAQITATAGKLVLDHMLSSGEPPGELVARLGLSRVDDRAELEATIDTVLAAEAANVQSYRNGKTQLLGFFVGKVMAATGGRADAPVVREVLVRRLDS
jgi:glutaminyl-tRNA synthetase